MDGYRTQDQLYIRHENQLIIVQGVVLSGIIDELEGKTTYYPGAEVDKCEYPVSRKLSTIRLA